VYVQLSFPLVRTRSHKYSICWLSGTFDLLIDFIVLVVYSPAYSRDAEMDDLYLQGKMRENGQRGSCHRGMGVTLDRRLRRQGNCLLGSLSTGSLIGHLTFTTEVDGLMYSQASVTPGNAGFSTACVIGSCLKAPLL
jgi:hypothetical protein